MAGALLAVAACLAANEPWPALAQTASPGTIRLADLGYNDDTLRGRGFSSTYFFPGPGDYPLAGSGTQLNLVFSGTSLAGQNSALSVSWNNVPVADIPLANKEQRQSVSIPIPTDRIDPGANRLDLRGDLDRDTGVCRTEEEGLHFTVYKESAVTYALSDANPHPAPAAPDLSRYPLPFLDSPPSIDSRLTFVLPPDPSAGVLQAAAAISAGLGRAAGSRPIDLRVATDTGQLGSELAQTNLIYVGQASGLPGLRQLSGLPLQIDGSGAIASDGKPVGRDAGVLMEAPSPANPGRLLLAVTGESDEAVVRAATALATRPVGRVIGGSSAIVDQLAAPAPSAGGDASGSARPVVTLADLGRTDETVEGPGDHSITFKLDLPGVPQGGGGLTLNLATSHSPLIDAANSSLRVTVNGVPLNSSGLKGANQNHDLMPVRLPASVLRSGVNQVQVTFTLRLNAASTNVCGTVPVEQAWAVLHSDTSLQLPTQFGSTTESDLAGYPYPFIGRRGLAETTFVVPGQFDVAPFLRYCSDLGRALGQDSMPPRVVAAGAFQPESTNANLIVWGAPGQNPLLSQLAGNLPLAIDSGEPRRYAFANDLLVAVRDSGSLGIIQQLPSPWAQGRQVLVISGTTAEAIPLSVAALSQPGLANNLALVSPAPAPAASAAPRRPGAPPAVDIATFNIRTRQQAATQRSAIELLPVGLAALFGLLALVMAASMAYEAFVREPRERR